MTRIITIFTLLLLSTTCFAQQVYLPSANSQERKEHLVIMHKLYDTMYYDQTIVFIISKEYSKSNGTWAFIEFKTQLANGKAPNFKKSAFREEFEEGIMDDYSYVLLKKIKTKWKLIERVDFPTDVSFGCWWKKYKAPKEIFLYAEDSCNEDY